MMSVRTASPRSFACAGACLLIASCATQRPAKAPAVPPGFSIVSTREPIDALPGATIFPMEPGEAAFILLGENRQPNQRIMLRWEMTAEYGASIAASEADRRIEFLAHSDDGSIVLAAAIDRDENALTLFDPPLIIAPAQLQPLEPFVSEASMRIVALDDPSRQRERGRAKRSITYLGDALIQTPEGDIEAAELDIRFTADLRFAGAEERTTLYVARDGSGPVALDASERVTILGVLPREKRRMLLREP